VNFSIIALVLLGTFIFCFLVQLYFTLFVHLKLAKFVVQDIEPTGAGPLTVVICARNEVANLQANLPSILTQEYPDFEVVVVNDRSWDGTKEVLRAFETEYSNLRVVTVPESAKYVAGKKFAVTMGIKAAKHEWLVFTDADCKPESSRWLLGMQQPKDPAVEIVLGYSPYTRTGGLLNALIRFETFFTAVNYLSFAIKGMPYMGVGRNMAYKKALFFKHKGFAAHMHIPSGDDDLFVNAHANAYNTAIQIHPDTFMHTDPKTTWGAYLKQKKRHFGAGKMYKNKHKFILSSQIIIQFLFYALLAALFCFRETQLVAGGLFVLSILLRSLIYPRLLSKLGYPGLRWWFPLLDILLFIFLVFNGILSIFVKKVQWK
jgi:biofilm PGA synthesis N-glycosyltransferase PgaC